MSKKGQIARERALAYLTAGKRVYVVSAASNRGLGKSDGLTAGPESTWIEESVAVDEGYFDRISEIIARYNVEARIV